jgi:hypothetical protein
LIVDAGSRGVRAAWPSSTAPVSASTSTQAAGAGGV